MSKWLLYDTHQQRFIKQLNPSTMHNYFRPFRTREEAELQIAEMGNPANILPIKVISYQEARTMIDENGFFKGGIVH